MTQNFTKYVSLFKELIMRGWIVVRDGRTSVNWMVNPNCEHPRKLYFREAVRELDYYEK